MTEQQAAVIRQEIDYIVEQSKEVYVRSREAAWNEAASHAGVLLHIHHIQLSEEVRDWTRSTLLAAIEKWYGPVVVEGVQEGNSIC